MNILKKFLRNLSNVLINVSNKYLKLINTRQLQINMEYFNLSFIN